ncbi:MAG: 2,3,4,5-tetrahydropyridine-2,6-dicarboxylate N-succinyltransferase [Leptospiraceae bacterium]|nr:2,3,4,5-tetrahydropyridine-2,6-dicarboxylate N-succinyltransferase [Leptospiraceae bacterium]MDW8306832.1 2,3,4,5-tetrahydropyridine-2,6-dicarboxylate N-succinyltransferase [Leptospiraceae bacterium]
MLESTINEAYEKKNEEPSVLQKKEYIEAIEEAIALLDSGNIRVAEPGPEGWRVNAWVKKAILLYFSIRNMSVFKAGDIEYWDKIPLKKDYSLAKVRVVPPAVARYGSFIEPGAILMPSYVNIGAYIGSGTMVDTWATVGSCAQVGKNVHISGGVGIGGVLEPPQAQPVIIEDNVFLGSRCVVVEGVHIESGAVLGSGVILTASTKIIDVTQKEPVILKGRVPRNSVVIPGSIPKEFPAGTYHVPCALIIGQRKESTDLKTSLNDVLREFGVDV